MAGEGFNSDVFVSEKIGRKWRQMFSRYKEVKDNNGRTGKCC